MVPSFKQAVLLLLIGVFGSLGQAFITYAYRFAPASEISIYNYSGIIFSMILGFFYFGRAGKIYLCDRRRTGGSRFCYGLCLQQPQQ